MISKIRKFYNDDDDVETAFIFSLMVVAFPIWLPALLLLKLYRWVG